MATMKDVAQLAGVSTATVSRALMNPEKVSSSTRKRVEDAVLEAGYSPNSLARNLRRNESKPLSPSYRTFATRTSQRSFVVLKMQQWNTAILFYWATVVSRKSVKARLLT